MATASGIKQRFNSELPDWLNANHAQIIFQFIRNNTLSSTEPARNETWYLVRFER